MKRRLVNILVAISAGLCALTLLFWVRSYLVQDSLVWFDGELKPVWYQNTREIVCARGGIRFSHEDLSDDQPLYYYYYWMYTPPPYKSGHTFTYDTPDPKEYPYWPGVGAGLLSIQALGFEYISNTPRLRSLTVPFWIVAVYSVILPAWWLSRKLREPPAPPGTRCVACGYDLRATPARCPECGLAVRYKRWGRRGVGVAKDPGNT